jgi:hypothetical protein
MPPSDSSWLYLSSSDPESFEYSPESKYTWNVSCAYNFEGKEEEMTWSSTQGASGPRLELSPGVRQLDHPEWWECGDYLGINFEPKVYNAVSLLPPVVMPLHSSSTTASETQPLSSNEVPSPLHPTMRPLFQTMQTPSRQSGDAIQTVQRTIPVQNSPGPTDGPARFQDAAPTAQSRATISVDGVAFTAIAQEGQTNIAQLGSATLSVGGPAYTSASHTFTLASSGLIVDGTVTASFSSSAAGQSVAALQLGGVTAVVQLAEPGTALFGSQTLSVGGPAFTTAGHVISLAPGGIVMDGTSTVSFASAEATSRRLSLKPLGDFGITTSESPDISTKKPLPTSTVKQSLGAPAVSWKLSLFLVLGFQSLLLVL